jgi:hypothetical protein
VLYIGVGLLLLLLTVLALAPRRELSGSAWALFRCFWPSWRFFDSPEELPLLCVRSAESGAEFGPFRDVLAAPVRRAGSLFLNGAFNLELAYFACAESLLREAESLDERPAEDLVSYELVRRLVESRLSVRGSNVRYQFALCDPTSGDPYILSRVHTQSEA